MTASQHAPQAVQAAKKTSLTTMEAPRLVRCGHHARDLAMRPQLPRRFPHLGEGVALHLGVPVEPLEPEGGEEDRGKAVHSITPLGSWPLSRIRLKPFMSSAE